RGRWGIRMYARLLVSAGLALWLLPDTVGAQQQSVDLCKGQVVQSCQADPEVQNQTHEAFKAFAELLAVSQSAAAPGSHWRVRLASWRGVQGAWEKASAPLLTPVQGLQQGALSLRTARKLIEQADDLFLQARESSDSTRAAELLVEHEKLQEQAEGLVRQAQDDYRAARNTSLKDSGVPLSASDLTLAQEGSTPRLEGGVETHAVSAEKACQDLRGTVAMYHEALASPGFRELKDWSDLKEKTDALVDSQESPFPEDWVRNCHCPILTARDRLEE